jgi:ceramide glucosyltransferase
MNDLSAIEILLLLPVVGGSLYSCACVVAVARYLRKRRPIAEGKPTFWPPVTLLKPCYGADADLEANLRSACELDYPSYQVVLSVQRLDDPALPILHRVAADYGSERVTVVADELRPAINGKIQNLANAVAAARHEWLVISDSDVRLRPDYLKAVVAPLADPAIGACCTCYRAVAARSWSERLELLTYNADFTVSVIFAEMTGAADCCLGSSVAVRRSLLESIGGFAALSEYLVEDYEMGRRFREAGYRTVVIPYFVDLIMDVRGLRHWWDHQIYWDQNTRVARPFGFFCTILTRAVPFALLFALVRSFAVESIAVVAATLVVRLACAWAIHGGFLGDRETVRNLWLLPLRDVAGLASWFAALTRRTVVWRGRVFEVARDGRMVAKPATGASPIR